MTAWRWHWLILALAALPLLFLRPAWLPALLALPAAWWLQRAATGRGLTRTVPNVALGVLVAAGTVAYGVATYVSGDWTLALQRLAALWLGWSVYRGLAAWGQAGNDPRRAWNAFALGGGLLALAGIFGGALPDKWPLVGGLARAVPRLLPDLPGAPGGYAPNEVAGALLFFLPAAAVAWRAAAGEMPAADRRRGSAAALLRWGTLATVIVACVLMQSRGALLGAAAATLGTLPWFGRRPRQGCAAIVVILAVTVAAAGPARLAEMALGSEVQDLTGQFEPDFRLRLWRAGAQATLDFPFTGMGLGMFRTLGPELYEFPARPADVGHAHNFFLHSGAEMGVPGLVSSLVAWLGVGWLIARALWRGASQRSLWLAAWWAWLAWSVFGLFDTVAIGSKGGVVWWIYLGLVAALLSPPVCREAGGEHGALALNDSQRATKRVIDICLARLGLIVSAPAMALAAIAIKLDDGGPVLYRSQRVGERGRLFTMLKLRSMVPGSDERWHSEDEAQCSHKMPGDARSTRCSCAGARARDTSPLMPVLMTCRTTTR